MLLLALALAPVLIDPAHCRQHSNGASRWQTDGRGTLTASTEPPFTGKVELRCRVRFDSGVTSVAVDVERVRVAFRPSAVEGGRSGVVIKVEGQTFDFLQVTREDWIEASQRSWRVDLPGARKEIEISLILVDDSATGSVRADVRALRVTPFR